jgi:hypothetical protein
LPKLLKCVEFGYEFNQLVENYHNHSKVLNLTSNLINQ